MGKDRDWGKLLLAAIPIHGLDDYVDDIKLALRDHGIPVVERSVDGGLDMDGLEEVRFGMGVELPRYDGHLSIGDYVLRLTQAGSPTAFFGVTDGPGRERSSAFATCSGVAPR